MEPRPVTPLKPGKGPDGGNQEQTLDGVVIDAASVIPAPDPTGVAVDVALDALAVFLDTTTTTRQRTDAAQAVKAIRERRARDRPGTP